MATQLIKQKKWSIVGGLIGMLLFPTLSYLLDIVGHLVRLVLGL